MIGYFNKKGALIKRSEWNKRMRAKSYRMYKEYDNRDILVQAEWHGVGNRDDLPENRKIFRLTVSNMVNGKWVKDISMTEDFSNVDNMMAKYEGILLEHTECELDDEFEFVEKGNVADPIPVPKKKEPTVSVEEAVESFTMPEKLVPDEEVVVEDKGEPCSAAPSTSYDHLGEWS